jgi:hypothetical protein
MSFIVKTCTPESRTAIFLACVEISDPDEDGMRGQHLRRKGADLRELGRLRSEQRRQRHAMDIA